MISTCNFFVWQLSAELEPSLYFYSPLFMQAAKFAARAPFHLLPSAHVMTRNHFLTSFTADGDVSFQSCKEGYGQYPLFRANST